MAQAEIEVDLDVIRDNVATLRAHVDRPLMAVVKADGYGHGLVASARAAVAGGADALGVAWVSEALALRAAGVTAPVLAWLTAPGDAYAEALDADVTLSVGAGWALAAVVAAARATGRTADLHLEVDTGLSRAGVEVADWPDLLAGVAAAAAEGTVRPVGLWSHFAYADAPGHPTIDAQRAVFLDAVDAAARVGLGGLTRHLANSAATLTRPDAWLDLVRPGIACYGLDPLGGDPGRHGLRPAMRVSAEVALVKRVPAGRGVSYGHEYVTTAATGLALVPIGYAEGVPRAGGNRGPVQLAGRRRTVAGRVCMDQFVIDVGDDEVAVGDRVVLWGPGDDGEPTAQDWAEATGTIHYELVTRIGGRMRRRYRGTDPRYADLTGAHAGGAG